MDIVEETRFKLPPEMKIKWLEALRSGTFPQDKGRLKSSYGYCCLGVYAHVLGSSFIKYGSVDVFETNFKGYPGEYMTKLPHGLIPDSVQTRLMDMNDGGMSFSEIADWIEANF